MLQKTILAVAASFTLISTSCAAENQTKSASSASEAAEEATLTAVLVYADWCASCKILDPKLKAVQTDSEFPGVKFVTIDYTDRDADALFKQADERGVGKAVRSFLAAEVKTGQLLLVDMDDNRVVGKVVKSMDEAEIAGAIKATQLAS